MASLEERIRQLAASGEMTHLSVIAISGRGPGGVVFAASYAPATPFGQGVATHADPVQAILGAISNAPKPEKGAPSRKAPKKPSKRKRRDKKGEEMLGLD